MAKKKARRTAPTRPGPRPARASKKKSKSSSLGVRRGARASKAGAAPRSAASAEAAKPPRPGPGEFAWHELLTDDVARCRSFYAQLFGWKASQVEMMPGFHYTLFNRKGANIAGMMAIAPEQAGVRPHWILYVAVSNVDAAAQKAEAMGGEIIIPPHDIPVGRWALLRDPTGAEFALYKAKG